MKVDAHPETYRPDIDGLRAVAVMLVIAFHVSPTLLPGGFVGVDVFFVISGYLITSIILRETRAGTFSLLDFYARRCRRILPALVVVLATTWVAGRVALTPLDFRLVGRHIVGGATFTSNILLWRETGYFDLAAVRKPLLHLWSLSVEEQFYLLWPPLLMATGLRGWQRPLWLSVILLAISIALAVAMLPTYNEAVFYLLPTRMWELLTGAVLVLWESGTGRAPDPSSRESSRREWMAVTGSLLIVTVTVFDLGISRARIAWLAAPVTGAILLMSSRGSWINRKLLARDPVVLVGLISFPLYLWHWPLLSLVTLLSVRSTVAQLILLKWGAVALSFMLAWATWQYIERPVRRFASAPASGSRRKNQQLLALSACVLLALSIAGWRTFQWYPEPAIAEDKTNEREEALAYGAALFPDAGYHRVSRSSSVVLFLGDSHADRVVLGIVPVAQKHGFGVSHVGLPGCLGVELSQRLWGTPGLFERCQALATASLAHFLKDPAVTIIALAARGTLYSEGREEFLPMNELANVRLPVELRLRVLQEGYANAIRRIEAAGKRAVLIIDVPELDFEPGYCVVPLSTVTLLGRPCATARRAVNARQATYRTVVQRLKADNLGLTVFDPTPLLCDSLWCYARRNGQLLYGDNNHLTLDGTRVLAESLDEVLFPRR